MDALEFNTKLARLLQRLKKDVGASGVKQNYRGTGSQAAYRQVIVKAPGWTDVWLEEGVVRIGVLFHRAGIRGVEISHDNKMTPQAVYDLIKGVFEKAMGESVDDGLDGLIRGLEEAVYGLKGRTTDIRQQLPQMAQGPSPYAAIAPGDWLVAFPDDMYPSSQSFMGPVAVALVGHRSMSDEAFSEFMRHLHRNTYPRQISEPAVAVEAGHLTDLRRLTRGGDYHPALKYLSPASCYLMEDLVVLVDGILYNHLSHQGLSEYNRSGKIFTIGEVITGLTTVAKGLVEPHNTNRTLGDIVNRVSWPFSGGTVGTQRTL